MLAGKKKFLFIILKSQFQGAFLVKRKTILLIEMSHFKEVIGQIIFLFTGKKKFLSIFYTIRKVAAGGRRHH